MRSIEVMDAHRGHVAVVGNAIILTSFGIKLCTLTILTKVSWTSVPFLNTVSLIHNDSSQLGTPFIILQHTSPPVDTALVQYVIAHMIKLIFNFHTSITSLV